MLADGLEELTDKALRCPVGQADLAAGLADPRQLGGRLVLIRREHHATLNFSVDTGGTEEAIRSKLAACGFRIASQQMNYIAPPDRVKVSWELQWMSRAVEPGTPDVLREIASRPEVSELEWKETRASAL